jgi:hypothetical protein
MITGKQECMVRQGRAVVSRKRPGAVDFPTPLILELWGYADLALLILSDLFWVRHRFLLLFVPPAATTRTIRSVMDAPLIMLEQR